MHHTATTARDMDTRPRVGDTISIDGGSWADVRDVEYGYSPAGIPTVTLTLWRAFSRNLETHWSYLAPVA